MKTIWYFVKFFSEEEHANQFMDGNLFLNRLSYFMQLESSVADGRGDSNEAVYLWAQPDDAVISINIPGIGSAEIGEKDLAAPIRIQTNKFNYFHVLCMHSVHTDGFNHKHNNIYYKNDQADKLKSQIRIDQKCKLFGNFSVIVPATLFLDKVKEGLSSKGFTGKGKLVSYYDENIFSGEIAEDEIPFTKQSSFSYQREFRIIVMPKSFDNDPVTINIGSIRDMSRMVNSNEINKILKVDSIK